MRVKRVHTYALSVLTRSLGVENVLLQMVTRDTEGDTSQPTSWGFTNIAIRKTTRRCF
jgi:hypothetical protein